MGLALLPGLPGPAAWAKDPTPSPSSSSAPALPFGVQAGLYGLTTLPGGHFSYSLKAGARVDDSAIIYNQSAGPLTFQVYGADVSMARGGGLAPAQQTQHMTQVGAWLMLHTPASVTVPAHGQTTIGFSLAVPPGTPPGTYVGAFVTSLRGAHVDNGLSTETRIARLVQLTVPGRADLELSLSTLQSRRAGSGETFTVTVHNTGNVLFAMDGKLRVSGGKPSSVTLAPAGLYVIPGGTATLRGTLSGLPRLGRRGVTAEITATVPNGPKRVVRSNTVRLSFFPWVATGSVAVVVVGAIVALVLTRRRWRSWLVRRRQERVAVRALRAQMRSGTAPPTAPSDPGEGSESP
ncbi:hypothetical protein GCM10023322_11740 [Rugosimonospora acidiphila]|uniref:DUF916 domain-containing protein n=2 Tax=Rugosimonospora acidiphila TaxID=556531 RepID=A0ABP9RMX5_9ACTN